MSGSKQDNPGAPAILLLCTANRCRSPMAAALLAGRLARLGVAATVRSAGMRAKGELAPAEVLQVMTSYGIDLGQHRSRVVSARELTAAGLVIGMAREHVRYAVVTAPVVWPRAFTLKELVRRAGLIGPRSAGEPLARWLLRVHAGRDRGALLGSSADDDIADPADGPLSGYAVTAAELDALSARLAELGWAHAGAGS
jgi:protein-tyrosine phosphatase